MRILIGNRPSCRAATTVAALFCLCRPAGAEVLLDGSLGPAGPPPGSRSQVVIPAELGRTVGSNLFHSFGEFSIGRNQSATFTGPAAIDNVIGRVTGGNPSTIDGALRSEIPSANLWLINPAGVLFGRGASLSIDGSLHVSTADYLRLRDGGRFDATHPERSLLTVAAPQSFGFLGDAPAPIVLDGVGLESEEGSLLGPDGQTLSFVGGDITIRGESNLQSRGGFINLASVASPGEAMLEERGIDTSGFPRLGRVAILEQSNLGEIDVEGTGLAVRAGSFEMDNATISAMANATKGKGFDIRARDDFAMNGSFINTSTVGSGDGGDIAIAARTVNLAGGSELVSLTQGAGKGGTVTIDARQVSLRDGSKVSTQTDAAGAAGDIRIHAARLKLDGNSKLSAETMEAVTGAAGRIDVRVGRLDLDHQSEISVASRGPGPVGKLKVRAGSVNLRGGSTLTSRSFGEGDGGDDGVVVNAGNLRLSQHSAIASDTSGPGRASDIDVTARRVELTGGARISAASSGDGQAGSISIRAGEFVLTGASAVVSATSGSGTGGSIALSARRADLDQGSRISAESTGSGRSGTVALKQVGDLHLANGSRISVATATADAGDIHLDVRHRLQLESHSRISTSVADGRGDGGNITIDPFVTVLEGGSAIVARAKAGSGGNIRITTDNLFRSPDSVIDASSELGIDGTVQIQSPETYLSAGITALPAAFLHTASLLARPCHERLGGEVSSLTVRRYELLPDSPYALSAQLPAALGAGGGAPRRARSADRAPAGGLALSSAGQAGGCGGHGWQHFRDLDRQTEQRPADTRS